MEIITELHKKKKQQHSISLQYAKNRSSLSWKHDI